MEKMTRYFSIVLIVFAITSSGLYAQYGKCPGGKRQALNGQTAIPDLTDEQTMKITEFRVEKMKAVAKLKLDAEEKQIQLARLERADDADMKAISEGLDELFQIKKQIAIICAKHKQKIRAILTEDQKLYFDLRHSKKMNHGKCGTHANHNMRQRANRQS